MEAAREEAASAVAAAEASAQRAQHATAEAHSAAQGASNSADEWKRRCMRADVVPVPYMCCLGFGGCRGLVQHFCICMLLYRSVAYSCLS